MLAAYFIRERGMTPEQAYSHMKAKRTHVDFHAMHWECLNGYVKFLAESK